jgi:multiple sugar transport system substrate-binding protein
MILSLCACSNSSENPQASGPAEPASPETSGSEAPPESETVSGYTPPEMNGEISINVYESAEWLETAVKMFTEKYSGMQVNIRDFYNGTDILVNDGQGTTAAGDRPSGQTREDYISQLNTQILSGKADDIIITSIGLPMGRYIKMGVFENLSFYLGSAEEINADNYYMNIFDACRTVSGAVYQFPLSATAVPTVRFEVALLQSTGLGPASGAKAISWREALDIGKQMYGASTLANTFMPAPRSILGDLFTKTTVASINYDTGAVEIDRDKIKALLNVFDELKDYKTMPRDFNLNNESHTVCQINYVNDAEAAMLVLDNKDTILQWQYDDGKVYLSPYYALDFGITSQSENKELSWEFLKFLVSDEVQTLPSFPNAGVNKNGLRARVAGYMSSYGRSAEDISAATAIVDGWVSQISAYRTEDTDILQISEGTFNDFADGLVSADESIDNLIKKLEQYMNE